MLTNLVVYSLRKNKMKFKDWEHIFIGAKEIWISEIIFSDEEFLKNYLKRFEKDYWKENIFYSNNREDFENKINKNARKKYCKGWSEIDRSRFWEMLEVLPPEKYTRGKDFSIFRMSEYETGSITNHFMQKWNKFYEGCFDTKDYWSILDLIKEV